MDGEALEALRRAALFATFRDEDLAQLGHALARRDVRAGGTIVREGDRGRAMFLLARGRAHVESGGIDLGALGPGEVFGEIALIVGTTRTASVIADEDCVLMVLDQEAFEAFAVEHPTLALGMLRHIVETSSARLARMNESLGHALRERGLPRRIEVRAWVDGEPRTVRTGTFAHELLPATKDGAPVVAALVDGRARSLDVAITSECRLEALTTAHWEGRRIYRRSLGLALLEAGARIGLRLSMGASLGFAQRLIVEGGARPDTAARLGEALERLIAEDASLVREGLGVPEAVEYLERAGQSDAARLVRTTRQTTVTLASYGDLFMWQGGPLLTSTGRLGEADVVADGDHLLLVFAVPGHLREAPRETMARQRLARESGLPPVDVALRAREVSRHSVQMTEQQERWLRTLGVGSVGDFNQRCIAGSVGDLIHVAEGFHEKSIGRIADALAERADEVRVVCIAGPSSSGKTTFIRRLRVQLQVNGLNPKGLGLDDYYVDRDATPKDEDGDFDFEAFDALRLDLLGDHLARLARGEEVRTAHFDFRAGKSHPAGGPSLQLGDRDLLMLEGIHGLNPALYARLPAAKIFRIFVCPLVQLPFDRLSRVHASDLRLLRRIVRDRHGRAQPAAETILRWPKVRAGERKHIFPYQHHAQEVFDTSLVYEISVLKVFAERYLLEVPTNHEAQATAERLLAMLDRLRVDLT
ncbi:MAG: cyclic nucleotide-binding domain-containing protein [Sandaracinaceae bacterium]